MPQRPVNSTVSDAEWHTMHLGDHHFTAKDEAAVQIKAEHKHKKHHRHHHKH